jgi:hypothetical protein
MQSHPNRLWLAALVLGFAFDFLFWKHAPGLAFAIYLALTLAAGFTLLGLDRIRAAPATLALLAPLGFFGVVTFSRAEPFTLFMAYALALFLMALLAATFVSGRWPLFGLADYVLNLAKLLGSMFAQPVIFRGETSRSSPGSAEEAGGAASRIWPVLRGLLIALPVVVIFAALLSSADMVFADRLGRVVDVFRLERLPEYLWRLIYILIIAYALAGVYLHASRKSGDRTLLGVEKPLVRPFLGFTEAAIVLGSVIVLFAAFVLIQVQYFFGGQTNIGVQGYTYAEYARRGFGELVAVAFFSLLLFLGLSAITRRETARQQTIFAALGVALGVLVGVILLSAYDRLVLYEAAYGFTRLRTYTHVFLIWIGLLLLAVVLLDLFRRQRLFAFAALMAALGFAISLALLNVDGFIARHNLQRAQAGLELDGGYLAQLSTDAVPVMVRYYRSPGLDRSIQVPVGAALACINAREGFPYQPEAWQSFNLSPWRGSEAVAPVLDEIAARYPVKDGAATAPSGQSFPCYGYSED